MSGVRVGDRGMMHATDIIGWTFDGAIYCTDHGEPLPPEGSFDEPCPVFADLVNEVLDDTCDTCHRYLVERDVEQPHVPESKANAGNANPGHLFG